MPSYTFSFRVRAFVFGALVIVSAAAIELYCRSSPRFNNEGSPYAELMNLISSPPTDRVALGDSHIARVSHLPGFKFLGMDGQKPEELLLLVERLTSSGKLKAVILEASPQWFASYHQGRNGVLTAANMGWPIEIGGLTIYSLSPPYSGAIFDNLVLDLKRVSSALITQAHADIARPPPTVFRAAVRRWEMVSSAESYNWHQTPHDDREILTANRVIEQNPIDAFASSVGAKAFEKVLKILSDSGAEVCMYRTPVTQEYLTAASELSDSRYNAFDDYARKLSAQYKFQYVDFKSLPIGFSNSMFWNQDHLTERAARIVWPHVADACFKN